MKVAPGVITPDSLRVPEWERALVHAEALRGSAEGLALLIENFDRGVTPIGDISTLSVAQRGIVLAVGRSDRAYRDGPEANAFERAGAGLRNAMSDMDVLAGTVSWNAGRQFVAELAGHMVTGLDSAHTFDYMLRREHPDYAGAQGLAALLNERAQEGPEADAAAQSMVRGLIQAVVLSENLPTIGHYLAERSLAGELEQHRLYGAELAAAKQVALDQLTTLAASTGLRPEFVEQAHKRIERAAFGAGDLVLTSPDQSDAICIPASLRIDKVGPLNPGRDTVVLLHELIHASAAQAFARLGLTVDGWGVGIEHTEGMAEFLASMGLGIDLQGTATELASRDVIYPARTAAMRDLYLHHFDQFALLYNAHYGQVDNAANLAQALMAFSVKVGAHEAALSAAGL